MSDHHDAPDPMDKAYAQAEAVLSDEAARAARRARVLGAVAAEPAAAPTVATPSTGKPAWWAPGGWLVAASVAGLSVLIAVEVYQPPPIPPPAAPTAPAPAVPTATAPVTAPAGPAPDLVAPPISPAPAVRARAPRPEPAPSLQDVAPMTALPSQPPPPAPPPPRDVVVTAQRRAAAPSASRTEAPVEARGFAGARASQERAAPAKSAGDTVEELVITSGRRETRAEAATAEASDQAVKLRDAAAAGQTREMAVLLARGAPVDMPDDDGETALMKAVQGNHPAAVALLRRHDASLDLKNGAGVSARDMAARIADPKLNRALGIRP